MNQVAGEMEGSNTPRDPRQRSRQSPYPRAPSRGSTTSSAGTPSTPKTFNSSSSTLASTAPSLSHPVHKYHHSNCASTTPSVRPSSRHSRQPKEEGSKTPVMGSAYLQERLQAGRQAESDRVGKRNDVDTEESIGGSAHFPLSPIRRSATAGAQEDVSIPRDTSMGLREGTEKLDLLLKENFNLKLEVFHRKEKMQAMQDRLEELEPIAAAYGDLQVAHGNLQVAHEGIRAELEKRDKAVGEAVNMIISLEATVEKMNREREMISQIEADGAYLHSSNAQSPGPGELDVPGPRRSHLDGVKRLERQPSFLSEHSEQTSNLRSVVLENTKSISHKDSLMHMRRISESSVDPSEFARAASPSLSVLSESSFMSIYGPKNSHANTPTPSKERIGGFDGASSDAIHRTPVLQRTRESQLEPRTVTPLRPSGRSSRGGLRPTPQMHSLNGMLDAESPLHRVQRLEKRSFSTDDVSRPSTSGQGRDVSGRLPALPPSHAQAVRTKEEKREALRKVMTNIPTDSQFFNSHMLPPTPDTVSSSMLRKHATHTGSQDSLPRVPAIDPQPSMTTMSGGDSVISGVDVPSRRHPRFDAPQPVSRMALGRGNPPLSAIDTRGFPGFDHLARNLPQRPRSAGETTTSRARADSWMSDSDSDGGADARSDDGDVDYWIRESMKSENHPRAQRSQPSGDRPPSPDLFSFPTSSVGWETDVIFGALKGQGCMSPVATLKRDPLDEAMARSPNARAATVSPAAVHPPVPPHRGSSMHARGDSNTLASSSGGNTRKSLPRSPNLMKARSNSIDSTSQVHSIKYQQQQNQALDSGRRNHYPPIAGQPQRSRGLGINFFKRSGSDAQSPVAEGSFDAQQSAQMQKVLGGGRSSVPPPQTAPWSMRSPDTILGDENDGATPPPTVMRNRPSTAKSVDDQTPTAHQRRGSADVNTMAHGPQGDGAPVHGHSNSNTGMKKWLGFGKIGSLKTRN